MFTMWVGYVDSPIEHSELEEGPYVTPMNVFKGSEAGEVLASLKQYVYNYFKNDMPQVLTLDEETGEQHTVESWFAECVSEGWTYRVFPIRL